MICIDNYCVLAYKILWKAKCFDFAGINIRKRSPLERVTEEYLSMLVLVEKPSLLEYLPLH